MSQTRGVFTTGAMGASAPAEIKQEVRRTRPENGCKQEILVFWILKILNSIILSTILKFELPH